MKLLNKLANLIFYPKVDLSANPIGANKIFAMGFLQKVIGFNRSVPWPVHFTSTVINPKNIVMERGSTLPGFSPGCYIQANQKIFFKKKTRIGPGVKIISEDHDILDIDSHKSSPPIVLGENTWIAANVVILPGVVLGAYTAVGAGAVVTKSFEKGYQVLGEVPAKVIKQISKEGM